MLHESIHSTESQEVVREYNTHEQDYDTIDAIERDEMIQNPENVGFNLTNDQFISPRRMNEVSAAQHLIDEVGEEAAFAQLSEKYGIQPDKVRDIFESTIAEEMSKVDRLNDMLADLPDGVSFRVHAFAPFSPFSMENCRHEEDGVEFFSFDPIALEQMRAVYEKVNSGEKPGDLTVVMNPFTSERGGNLPETPEDIQAYADMCLTFLGQMGFSENTGGICLELGNETNVDRSTLDVHGQPMFNKEDFADKSDPAKYGHMYAKVSAAIKAKYPNVKVGIAGTAMFDDKYLEGVISAVNNPDLIDKLSFHPYRGSVEKGAPTFSDNACVDSPLNYEQQLARMQELADSVGATYDVGEVSFTHKHGESVDMNELHKNSADAKARGIKSYTWPERQILMYD